MLLGFPRTNPGSHNRLCALGEGCVLHHCSYGDVNGWLPLDRNNPLTSRDAVLRGIHFDARRGQRDTQVQSSWLQVSDGGTPQRPAFLHMFVRVSRHLPARTPTIRTHPCGTEGDNRVNWREFL